MFEGINEDNLSAALEALLFVSDEPLDVLYLSKVLDAPENIIEAALKEVSINLSEASRGVILKEIAGGWRLYTNPDYDNLIKAYVLSWDTRKLSAAALESLAIIAFTQPITRSGLASVRGVSSDSSVNSLLEKGLIKEVGVADSPGNPALYGTTKGFLEKFGLNSLEELPDILDFAPDDKMKRLISERLGITDVKFLEQNMRNDLPEPAPTSALEGLDFNLQIDSGAHVGFSIEDAIADSSGLVQKIDFNSINFNSENSDDE